MIRQPGDHYAAGDEGYQDAPDRRGTIAPRIALYGDHSEIVMQAARTRMPSMGDALALVILQNQRATACAARATVIERAHRFDWPILIKAGLLMTLEENVR